MKINEISEGEVFTIGETPSYPKLKLAKGYVDMRDHIINTEPNQAVMEAECRIIDTHELAEKLVASEGEIKQWVNLVKKQYLL